MFVDIKGSMAQVVKYCVVIRLYNNQGERGESGLIRHFFTFLSILSVNITNYRTNSPFRR